MLPLESRILIVDDVEGVREFLKTCLLDLGYENIDEADDGITAWPKIIGAFHEGEPYLLICSDWKMPLMSGIDLLVKVRGRAGLENTLFIMVSGQIGGTHCDLALKSGANGYLNKPFETSILSAKISEAIVNRRRT